MPHPLMPSSLLKLRPLGNTGLTVSPLGLGTVKLGRNTGLKYPGGDGFALPSDEQATELLRAVADCGINLIDTAPAYGASEERLGTLLPRIAPRDRWVVCTKAGEEFDPASATSRHDFSPSAIRASVERSLRRLRIDTLDVVLLHSDGRDKWILRDSGALEALRDLKQQGKLRALGLSSKTVAGGLCAVALKCDVVMVTLNPAATADLPVIAAARQAGVGVLVKKALSSGHAADASAALRLAAATAGVSSVIVGSMNPDNVRINAKSLGAG